MESLTIRRGFKSNKHPQELDRESLGFFLLQNMFITPEEIVELRRQTKKPMFSTAKVEPSRCVSAMWQQTVDYTALDRSYGYAQNGYQAGAHPYIAIVQVPHVIASLQMGNVSVTKTIKPTGEIFDRTYSQPFSVPGLNLASYVQLGPNYRHHHNEIPDILYRLQYNSDHAATIAAELFKFSTLLSPTKKGTNIEFEVMHMGDNVEQDNICLVKRN